MSKKQSEYILYGVIIGLIIGVIITLIIVLSFSNLQFETRDWILVFSFLIAMVGWFVTYKLNKKSEIYKRSLDFRTDMIKSVLSASTAWLYLKNNSNEDKLQLLLKDFTSKLEDAQVHVLMYGTEAEINLFDLVVNAAKNDNHVILEQNLFKLTGGLRNDLRKLIIV